MDRWSSKEQYQGWQRLWDHKTQYLFFGGAKGGGKSWLGCNWVHTACSKFSEVRYLIGRKELKNLKDTTLNTYYKLLKGLGVDIMNDIHYNEQRSKITYNNTGSEIILRELKHQPSDPMFQDLGSLELTGAFIDEAPEIKFEAFDTLKTCIGRQFNEKYNLLPAKILLTGNPTRNWTYRTFYKPFANHELPEEYRYIRSLAEGNILLDKGYLDNLRSLTDPVAKERFLYGNWEYENDPAKLINSDAITDIFTNNFVPAGPKCITADIARFGSDRAVILVWDGFRVIDKVILDVSKTTDIQDVILQKRLIYGIPNSRIVVDEDGVGGGVVDNLDCVGFMNGSSPIEITGQKENYENLKTQCYFLLAKRINSSGLYIGCFSPGEREDTIDELEQVKRDKIDYDGKLRLLPKVKVKELLGRSPDISDTLMMREYIEIIKEKRIIVPKNKRINRY